VHAEQQRADAVAALALARHPAADHELLASTFLIFTQSARAQPGPVGGVQALGDDPLETLLGARREQRPPVAEDVLGRLPAGAGSASSASRARRSL
jgi:hypothetical protein